MTPDLYNMDCLDLMGLFLADDSVDAIVTDPPYGIRFMGKSWDGADIDARAAKRRGFESHAPGAGPNGGHKSLAAEAGKYDLTPAAMRAFQEFSEEWALEAYRVLKPGGYLLSFASARTYHRMAAGIEDAGFEIRDQILWMYGQGFPKSLNLKGEHDGWGTALKPAHEPIVLARKPFKGTVAKNVALHGTGAINIDGCRVPTDENLNGGAYADTRQESTSEWAASGSLHKTTGMEFVQPTGRWPANIIHDGSDAVLSVFPDAPGQQGPISTNNTPRNGQHIYDTLKRGRGAEPSADSENEGAVGFKMKPGTRRLDSGSAARFFYCAKTSPADRHEGLTAPGTQFEHGATLRDAEAAPKIGNHHPTVKPTDLMAYLCRLVTPPGGVVLDPFMGSGSTGKAALREGFRFIGCELEPEYFAIAKARIAAETKL